MRAKSRVTHRGTDQPCFSLSGHYDVTQFVDYHPHTQSNQFPAYFPLLARHSACAPALCATHLPDVFGLPKLNTE